MGKAWIVAAVLLPGLLLAGCNTTRGIGKDVKSVGKAIEKSVD